MAKTDRVAAIVGAATSDFGRTPGRTSLQLIAQATARTLEDAGLRLSDVDGVACSGLPGYPSMQVAEYLGLTPTWSDSTSVGGASFELHLGHAVQAIRDGACRCVLICYGSTQASDRSRSLAGAVVDPLLPGTQFEVPYGPLLPITGYALAANRHMQTYGTTSEQLAEIAVATRRWAAMNPEAQYRDPIAVDDVLGSPMVSSPLHLLDCCLVTDGGAAILVVAPELVAQVRTRPAWVLGQAEVTMHTTISSMPDLTRTPGAITGPRAFGAAGLAPADVDVAEIYDSFTITVLLGLEDLGFCAKGEGGSFATAARLGPGGSFPLNTWGGGLSCTHPGMLGLFLLVEATRQLRGDFAGTPRQVEGADVALVHATGGVLSSGSTILLGRG